MRFAKPVKGSNTRPSIHSMSTDSLHLDFPHRWQATILERRPLIAPARHFIYPKDVDEVEQGALELLIRPVDIAPEFLATFALGFATPGVPTGVWACPNPEWLCAVAGGYAYLIDTAQPTEWEQVEYRPVLEVTPLPSQQLLLFSGHYSLVAYGSNGKAWESGRLSWEGFKILEVTETKLTGLGWDLITDQEYEFEVDLSTGEHRRAG
jgi:hypothetical protein